MRKMSERTMKEANGGAVYRGYKCGNCGWVIAHAGWACIVHDLAMGHKKAIWYDYSFKY